ncbi:hypothetical protein [Teredinibacter haidensis]|uniref:hypothetical protein n=1 Tax=Teredinibacter haidensis TaxID=2731755 RepID=UPI000948A3DE|nr:hypothetical protein [Teredinibacter haidensis]
MSNKDEDWGDILGTKLKKYSAEEIESSIAKAISEMTGKNHAVGLSKISFSERQMTEIALTISQLSELDDKDLPF